MCTLFLTRGKLSGFLFLRNETFKITYIYLVVRKSLDTYFRKDVHFFYINSTFQIASIISYYHSYLYEAVIK